MLVDEGGILFSLLLVLSLSFLSVVVVVVGSS